MSSSLSLSGYDLFIAAKSKNRIASGFDPLPIKAPLFDWQKAVVRWAVRSGCADYLLVFRKPGDNPRPVTKDPASFPVETWQEYASPVWMTVDQGRVLNGEGAREAQDERHICPLQLDVIERAVTLWSNPGDLVYSPFAGIGSEGYASLRLGRKFVGSELKKSYFELAASNLHGATSQHDLLLT